MSTDNIDVSKAQGEQLVQAIQSLQHIIDMQQTRQQSVVRRVNLLYRISFIAITVLVLSMSVLVIVLATHLPGLTVSINKMNQHFADITDNMETMRRSMYVMQDNVDALPSIIRNIDHMHSSTRQMSKDVNAMGGHMSGINQTMQTMTLSVTDMKQSFQAMDRSVYHMRRDVDHMSAPMRMFNSINPLR